MTNRAALTLLALALTACGADDSSGTMPGVDARNVAGDGGIHDLTPCIGWPSSDQCERGCQIYIPVTRTCTITVNGAQRACITSMRYGAEVACCHPDGFGLPGDVVRWTPCE